MGGNARAVLTVGLIAVLAAVAYTVPGVQRGGEQGAGPAGQAREHPTRGCRDATAEPWHDRSAARLATLCLHNAARREHGLPALTENPALRRAALRHSRAMVEQGFMAHVAPDGSRPVERILAAGYDPRSGRGVTAENLAFGEESEGTPAAIVDSWLRSPDHRANILHPDVREIGIGIVPRPIRSSGRGREGATYTTTFGG